MSSRSPSALLLVLALVAFLSPVTVGAHRIDVGPGKKECFFEDLHVGDQMTVTYQVGEGGNMDIDFFLTDPFQSVLSSIHRKPTGSFDFTAKHDGRYGYCFSNEMSSVSPKVVGFNVHGIIYVEGEVATAPVEAEIRALSSAVQGIKDEQEYVVVRERVHRNTAESTNDRVKWWALLQAGILVAVCAFNLRNLKSWFEVKRVL